MTCDSCGSELVIPTAGKKGGFCPSCGMPFKVAPSGAQVFDESALDKIAEKVADEIEARAEARRKVRKKKNGDDDEEEAERKRREKEEAKYEQ